MLLSYLREKIKERFCSAKVEISHQNLPFPDYAYNRNRHQYYSTAILAQMKKVYKEKDEFILGIIDVDLYVPELNFVFGEAEILNRVAIISLSRLKSKNEALFKERTLKEAVHELGHLYGLGHCRNPHCVMFFSNSILDTDRKSSFFCESCQIKLGIKGGIDNDA